MTEDQVIVRIENAMWRATADDMGAAYIPAGLLTNEQWEALSHAAWSEMKAIAQEDKAPTTVQSLLSPTIYPQYDPGHDNYIHRNGKRSYDKAGKHPV